MDAVGEIFRQQHQTMKQRQKSRADNGESRHAWAYYDLQMKLEYKQAINGRQVYFRKERNCSHIDH